ncbi:unnamed protein product [Rotaria sp. Silwood1]|nr:unnamed protein product [Rotaria sp. Silwood1]CAF1255480.1 unnamed protein product [Rotaria sp. Silwood1]CAF3443371.1 unnamed protein product [Rotaria sp. Silwood1]CAF3515040.1 unnamed protein product [Rotaria sp. Silwood1]CAF4638086.1 unnamed protein product [Rotaria sp. Silwood1]
MQFFPQQQCSGFYPQSQQCTPYSCCNSSFPNFSQQQYPAYNSLCCSPYYCSPQQASQYPYYAQQCAVGPQNAYGYKHLWPQQQRDFKDAAATLKKRTS